MEQPKQTVLEADRDRLLAEQNHLCNQLRFVERRLDNVIAELAITAVLNDPVEYPPLYVIYGGLHASN